MKQISKERIYDRLVEIIQTFEEAKPGIVLFWVLYYAASLKSKLNPPDKDTSDLLTFLIEKIWANRDIIEEKGIILKEHIDYY